MRFSGIELQSYVNKLYKNFADVVAEVRRSRAHPYEISAWIKKENREKDILVYRVTATDKYVSSLSVLDIYRDDSILLSFSKVEIKIISTLAILIHYKQEPKYRIVWENFRNDLHNQMLHLQDRDKKGIIKLKIDDLEKNIEIIDGMSSRDAYRFGKEVGIRERILEQEVLNAE